MMKATEQPRLPSRIFLALVVAGGLTVVLAFGVAFAMANAANEIARTHTSQTVERSALQFLKNAARARAIDYAWWSQAYDAATAGDEAWLYSNMGSATDLATFDVLALATADGVIEFAWRRGEGQTSDPGHFPASLADALRARLPEPSVEKAEATSGFAILDGTPTIVGAARIMPHEAVPDGFDPEAAPILFTGLYVTDALMAQRAGELNIADLRMISLAQADRLQATSAIVSVPGIDGAPLAALAYTPPAPGTALLRQAMVPLMLVTALLVFATGAASLTMRRQAEDIIKEKRAAREAARTDPLTGLFNRTGLNERLRKADVADALDAGQAALIYLDLDGFKAINDRFGHTAGDEALRITARRLKKAARASDILARVGGDEFNALIIAPDPNKTARAIVTRLQAAMREPVRAPCGGVFRCEGSFGIALGAAGDSVFDFIKAADAAMYEEKRRRKGERAGSPAQGGEKRWAYPDESAAA